ncbi:hypothetical protein BLOT_005582 [Blomia tropicalis]|nr:hypothetical protein BLOT_005582 [Blomia tropicalis]
MNIFKFMFITLTLIIIGNVRCQQQLMNTKTAAGSISSPSTAKPIKTTKNIRRVTVGFKYHNYDELTKLLKLIAKKFPDITKLYSIGKSVQGRELWVISVTSHNSSTDPDTDLKPNVKYVANMHANEAIGREMVLHLLAHLVNHSNKSTNVKNLLRHTRIHLMPSMNPDGFEKAIEGKCQSGPGRHNAANVDLNRNFPDRFFKSNVAEQPETAAIRKWIHEKQFALSLNIHGGALVVNYPFDGSQNHSESHIEKSPDHDTFVHLALALAKRHPKLRQKVQCIQEEWFENGITNGNAWYPIRGSMQDYNYINGGCMELTFEISCCKYPPKSELVSFWNDNKIPLLTFLTEVHKGVKGRIYDSNTEHRIANANITILGREMTFHSDSNGRFWRILLPGDYVLVVKANGYQTLQKQFTVSEHKITVINVYMAPIVRHSRSHNLQQQKYLIKKGQNYDELLMGQSAALTMVKNGTNSQQRIQLQIVPLIMLV